MNGYQPKDDGIKPSPPKTSSKIGVPDKHFLRCVNYHLDGVYDRCAQCKTPGKCPKYKYSLQFIEKVDYWSRVCEIQKRQTDKGLKKYGQVLEDTPDMAISTRLNHIEEELIDALMYIEHLKEILK